MKRERKSKELIENYDIQKLFLRLRQTNSEREKRVAVVGIELARHARQSRSLAA